MIPVIIISKADALKRNIFMTIHTNSQNEVAAVLKEIEKMMDEMIKKGLLPALDRKAKDRILSSVFDKLHEDKDVSLTLNDLKTNPDTRKALGVACMAECRPNNQFNYTLLFKKQNDLKPEELKKQFKSIFDDMLKLHPKMDPKKRAELDKQFDDLANTLVKQCTKSPDMLCENKSAFNLLAGCFDAASDYRRQLYGVDTHVTGAEFIPVQAEPIGDQLGFIDLSFGMGHSFKASLEQADPGVPDPIGVKMNNIINAISSGNLSNTVEQELISDHIIPKPDASMLLTPKG